ncbi:radical SAM/SPASM domain-containing protein [Salidesulfovibrio onnuriiensis]|uniref:radical SAM/SPASM domain-containing protein n=1 Tax=Salidesulfovibrio onnuriiensis TaxID=2583823 RepID=UPI0011C93CBA|nr:radical SAM protein [Salidesulfovibrio onnuriiensis]
MSKTMKTLKSDIRNLWNIHTGKAMLSPGDAVLGILIEPTAVCNLRCPYCPTTEKRLTRSNKLLPLDTFNRIVDLTRPVANHYVMNLYGEPILHPDIFEMLEKLRPLPVWLSTNLNYSEEKARKLASMDHCKVICSTDGHDEESYGRYRIGGDFEVVRRNLSILASGKCTVHPQFLINDENRPTIPLLAEFSQSCGVPSDNIIWKKMNVNFANRMDAGVGGKCFSPYWNLDFTADGMQIPCCMNVQKDLFVEHVDNFSTLDDVLNNPAMVEVRRNLARNKNVYASCRSCVGTPSYWRTFGKHLGGVAGGVASRLRLLKGGSR